ncbi:hypothetical protein O181_097685 [Austropuccinia psidii MF-1]|uniref:Uncharacterized protein n=1 Tax=Austropuccinia psidii MF-1 TaxID=1389203 RepID=A0A9Q3J7W3_9BASI|nr:hypothetical protein [Austropuccinia psidii MF-1]
MANQTPYSQLSSYKHINCLLSGNQDQLDDVHLGQMSPNLTNENMEQTNSGQITGQMNWEALPSETSTQRHKRHTSEEAQLYRQQREHECMLKRKQCENNRVNAEAA